MYIVAHLWTNTETGKTNVMAEETFGTVETALVDFNERFAKNERDLVILRVLPVKTVLIDFDAAGVVEHPIT